MRKMTYLSLLALVSLALFATGCSKDQPAAPKGSDETAKKSITFTIATPGGDPVTLKAAGIHDAPEWTVKSLTMYRFSADGSKLLDSTEVDMAKLQKTADAEYTFTKEFANTDAGTYRFIFVANDKLTGVTTGTSLANFQKTLMTKTLSGDGSSSSADLLNVFESKKYIPMSGVAVHGGSQKIALSGTTEPVKVELTRVVARVDVVNHIPNLVISGIALRHTSDRTSVFPALDADGQPTYAAPTGAQRVNLAKGFADIPTGGLAGLLGADGAKLPKALYLYEGTQPANEEDATAIVITGKLGGTRDVTYTIPFKENEIGYKPVTVKRNHLYILELGDNTPLTPNTKIKFTIEDTTWNAVTLNHGLKVISVEYNDVDRKKSKYDDRTQVLTTADLVLDYPIVLTTLYKKHTKFEVTPVPGTATDALQWEQTGNIVKIRIKKDKAPKTKFTAQFAIKSDANPNHTEVLTFVYDPDFVNTDPVH